MDKLKAVEKMQEYIKEHVGEDDFTPEQVCDAAGYSRRHADRMFKEYLGKTIQEYINAVCLTAGAEELLR
ncbi:AraC family transcriptional regulator, partial [Enterococcus faecalis]|uniref:AraC family transcriptional regulator n=1 Tax=Enterococcus faecalis TaxID=1351 RepID=UPI0039873D2B